MNEKERAKEWGEREKNWLRPMNGHEANTGEKSTFSYEAQMIICILIIYPLAVSAVHVMNEFFSPSSAALRLKAYRKETCCFSVFFLFHMFMNWRWSNCFARARCTLDGDTILMEIIHCATLWTFEMTEGLWHKGIWWGICVTTIAPKAIN